MKVVGIIPIKLNNERLPGKNIKMLGNKPLIKYILNTLNKVKGLDEVYVYCSNEAIVEYIDGLATFLKRDKKLDEKTANFTQIFTSFMNEVDADVYVYAHATAPFITKETIEEEIESVVSGKYDSAFTAEKIQDFLWEDGNPLNFDAQNVPRSQDLPVVYRETSGVYVFTKEVFEKYKRRIGMNPNIIEVDRKEMVDINYIEDFQLAEKMLSPEDMYKFPKRVKLLDCTLRDGGCVNNFNFGIKDMNSILKTVEDAGIDIVELGYINSKKGTKEERTQFDSVESINNFLHEKKEGTTYVAMIDHGTYNFDELPERNENGIDGIRIAFHKKDYISAIEEAKKVIAKGYKAFIQPMVIISYTEKEIKDLVYRINEEVPEIEAMYIVDSFGQMKLGDPSRILNIIDIYLKREIKLGFHGHNNLQMSFSNALEILNCDVDREIILDCSINGMGKGAGNMPTEIIIDYANTNLNKNYNNEIIYKAIKEIIEPYKENYSWGYCFKYLISSLYACTPSYVNFFVDKCGVNADDLLNILNMMDETKKVAFDESYANELIRKYNTNK